MIHLKKLIIMFICMFTLTGCLGRMSNTVSDFSDMPVLYTINYPTTDDIIRIVDNKDYFSFAPSNATIYINSKKYLTVTVHNDGAKLHSSNFSHVITEKGIQLTVDGDEQKSEIIEIPLEDIIEKN